MLIKYLHVFNLIVIVQSEKNPSECPKYIFYYYYYSDLPCFFLLTSCRIFWSSCLFAWFFYFCKYFFLHIIPLWSMNLLHKCFTFKNQIKISEKVMSLRQNFTTSNVQTMSNYRLFLTMVHEEDIKLNRVQLQTLLTRFFVHYFSHHTSSEAVLLNWQCACGKIF